MPDREFTNILDWLSYRVYRQEMTKAPGYSSSGAKQSTERDPLLYFKLPRPELYDLNTDPEESYDCAPENPQIVSQIQAKIATMIQTFPEQVKQAWA